MSTLSKNELIVLEALTKKHRIIFSRFRSPEEWPDCHRGLLDRVAALGDKRYSSYAADPGDTDDAPWKVGVKSRADILVTLAERARHRNESTWRFACEPLVLSRLTAEVVCRTCRKRVWRSEIEASYDDDGSRRGKSLRERQEAREPCRCSRASRGHDQLEAVGLNCIFGHRKEEFMRLEYDVAQRLGKQSQKPDAMVGLRPTTNIQNLLQDTSGSQSQQLHEILQPSPVDESGEELLYPFLVLEAKSGTSSSDWHSIRMQTAFPIRTLLETQNRLRVEAGSQDDPRSAPLVWFFGNRGEDWRVSVAYTSKNTAGNTDYIVMDVWGGSIVNPDGALQLLLLVDYVFDWARDVYRRNILRDLRLVTSGDKDAASVTQPDSAILSTRRADPPHMLPSTGGNDDYQAYLSGQHAFMAFDSSSCIVRHAAFVESKYCCVFATRDNVRTMLQSMDPKKLEKLCSLVLEQMADSIQLEESAIHAMEEHWTGTARISPSQALAPKMQFHTIISCTNYLTPSWHQIRELYIVAIADNAWDTVVEASKLQPRRRKTNRPPLRATVDVDDLLANVDRLQAGNPGDTLLACINRRAVTLELSTDDAGSKPAKGSKASVPLHTLPGEIVHVTSDGVLRDTVHSVYTYLKKGSIEPQESFLKLSTQYSQSQPSQDVEPVSPHRTHPDELQLSEDGCVLVYGGCLASDRKRSASTVCLYLVDRAPTAPSDQDAIRLTKQTLETRDVYHTTRDNGTSNINNLSTKRSKKDTQLKAVPWNIQDNYGIYSWISDSRNGVDHPILMRCGTSAPPDRQGSPRLSDSVMSGDYLHKRTMIPWSDPRLSDSLPEVRMFFIYKLMSREIGYWRRVAAARRSRGTGACRWCGSLGSPYDPLAYGDDECAECYSYFAEHKGEWLSNCLGGQAPFPDEEERSNYVSDDSDGEGVYAALLDSEWPSMNDRWKAAIGGYPALEEPFGDMVELLALCQKFRDWFDEREFERLRRDFGPSRKRRRLEDGPGSRFSAGGDSESQSVDDASESQAADNDSGSSLTDDDSDAEFA